MISTNKLSQKRRVPRTPNDAHHSMLIAHLCHRTKWVTCCSHKSKGVVTPLTTTQLKYFTLYYSWYHTYVVLYAVSYLTANTPTVVYRELYSSTMFTRFPFPAPPVPIIEPRVRYTQSQSIYQYRVRPSAPQSTW